jgi:hypothetical protein
MDPTSRLTTVRVFEHLELALCHLQYTLAVDEQDPRLPLGAAHHIAGVLDDLSLVPMAMEEAEDDEAKTVFDGN